LSTQTPSRVSLPTATWNVDPAHSQVEFRVKHVGIATFKGRFTAFDGVIRTEDDSIASVEGSVDVTSVRTNDERLDGHLQSPDFFDAERYPELSFESSEIDRAGDQVTVRGGITIKGVERPVVLTGTIAEPITDYTGNEKLSVKLDTTVDRTEFGVSWNVPLPDGKPALADEVKLAAELFFVKEA
jgi:polyisoprenoid-binding protein YceI